MKRNLSVISVILLTVVVYSFVIPATEARKSLRPFSSSGRNDAAEANHSETNKEQTAENVGDTHPITGQLLQTKRQDPELSKALRNYDVIRLEPRAAAAQIRKTGQFSVKTSHGEFAMQLSPNDLRASDYVAQEITADGVAHKLPRTAVNTYKGSVQGSPKAQARVTVTENSVEGAIITGEERYFIQPARALSKQAREDEFVFYNGEDVAKEAGTCGVTLADEVAARANNEMNKVEKGASVFEAEALNTPVPGLTPLKIARLATDADAEYVSALGSPALANAQIMSIMNLVDGIYQVEIGVTFQVVFQNNWTNAGTDPYSSTDPVILLDQFRTHWNSNFTGVQRSLAHLWTGKNIDGSTIGIASVGVVCKYPDSAYGFSQRFPLDALNPITAQTVSVTAHEMGHNFSASHTDDPEDVPSDVEQSCDETIMNGSVGPGSSFCPFSRSQIIGHVIANSSCLPNSTTQAPAPSCVETSINTNGVVTNGTISASDCQSPSRGIRYYADRYSFNATAGQQVTITMNGTTGNLDPYLYLIGPDGYVAVQDDDSNGNNNARIPMPTTGSTFTLPQSGKYIIEATSYALLQTGDYTITATIGSCTLNVTPANQNFPASGGSGSLNVTAVGTCASYNFVQYLGNGWLTTQTSSGNGSQALSFNVQANTNAAGRKAFLLVGASNTYGGLRIPITQSGTGPDCSSTTIAFGQTINGSLSAGDCQSPVRGNGYYTDRYVFTASAGHQVAITLSSTSIDTFLTLLGPNGVVLLNDDDSGGGSNSRVPGGNTNLTLGLAGTYTIEASTYGTGQTGPYSLTLTGVAAPTPTPTPTPSPNPLENADFFVSQHYRDFLDREPDAAGLNYWSGIITSCGADTNCISKNRISVSAAFFVEAEFQRTGSFVYRLYKGGLARRPTFQEFNTDRGQVVEGPGLEADKQALALAFVQRTEFVQRYAGQTTANSFVDSLILSIQQGSNVNLTPQRNAIITRYNAGANINQSRAFALREAIDSTAFVDGEYNAAFVLMQYFGYLRRDPDQGGYDFWLGIVNSPLVASYRSMVCAFLTSREYQERFSPVVPRNDSECADIN